MGGSGAAEAAGPAAGETVRLAAPVTDDFGEYAFLLRHGLPPQTLARACDLAARWGTPPHEVLIANGWVSEVAYHRALARSCGAGFVGDGAGLAPPNADGDARECLRYGLLRQRLKGRSGLAFSPGRARPNAVSAILKEGAAGRSISIATREALREAILRSFGPGLLQRAIHGLQARYPLECANGRMSLNQRVALATLAALLAVFGAIAPLETLRVATGLATMFFTLVVCLRLAACVHLAAATPLRLLRRRTAGIPDAELPVYTVLVPLFREANVAPGLVRALARLDYPALGSKRTS